MLRSRLLANRYGRTLEIRVRYEQVRCNQLHWEERTRRKTAGFKHIWANLGIDKACDYGHNGFRGMLGSFAVKIRNGLFTEAIRSSMTEEEVAAIVHTYTNQTYPNLEEMHPLPCLAHDREWNDIWN